MGAAPPVAAPPPRPRLPPAPGTYTPNTGLFRSSRSMTGLSRCRFCARPTSGPVNTAVATKMETAIDNDGRIIYFLAGLYAARPLAAAHHRLDATVARHAVDVEIAGSDHEVDMYCASING